MPRTAQLIENRQRLQNGAIVGRAHFPIPFQTDSKCSGIFSRVTGAHSRRSRYIGQGAPPSEPRRRLQTGASEDEFLFKKILGGPDITQRGTRRKDNTLISSNKSVRIAPGPASPERSCSLKENPLEPG